MEFLSVLLSVLLGIVSPGGLAVDQLVEDAIRSNVDRVEALDVRIDNTPTFQLVQGKVNKIRIAGSGVYPVPELRIATVELETDPIDVNIRQVRQGHIQFDQPFQSAARVTLTAADINQLLQSPRLTETVRSFSLRFLSAPQAIRAQQYEFLNPRVTFLPNGRILGEVSIQDARSQEQLDIELETGLAIVEGRQLRLVDPRIVANGEAVPQQFINALSAGISRRLDLRSLQAQGITVRILQLNIQPDQIETIAFIRVEPEIALSGR